MISIEEVEAEIRKVEADRATWSNCEKLSILYAVRDHLQRGEPAPAYSYASAPETGSEFIRAVKEADAGKALSILDEHMEELKLVYPKEYALILRKLRESRTAY